MKNKGFTLVELLAVIVILGVIALIAVPIIIGIVNDSIDETNKRSIDMYASAVENAVITYQLSEQKKPTSIEEVENYISYKGSEVVCATKKLYNNGEIYLGDCTVDGKEVDYEYGFGKGILNKVCKPADGSNTYSTTEGTKYTCKVDPNQPEYTFYVLSSTTDTEVNLIMAQNINKDGTPALSVSNDNKVVWLNNSDFITAGGGSYDENACMAISACENGIYGPITAMNYLDEATKNWTNLTKMPIDSFEECDVSNNCTSKPMSKSYQIYARMPYFSELFSYGTKDANNIFNIVKGPFIYDYLDSSDFNTLKPTNEIDGLEAYWTLSSSRPDTNGFVVSAWAVMIHGPSVSNEPINAYYYHTGVRPVITLSI